mmetsp:Transcript_25825/g.63667  ORF Transcript_25825/g.63667 Transcript_25825/m.63667 type:complete len:455 (-) Transcript_25825:312-1676(-)
MLQRCVESETLHEHHHPHARHRRRTPHPSRAVDVHFGGEPLRVGRLHQYLHRAGRLLDKACQLLPVEVLNGHTHHLDPVLLVQLLHHIPVDHPTVVVNVGLNVEDTRYARSDHRLHVDLRLRVRSDRKERWHVVERKVGRHEVAVINEELPLPVPGPPLPRLREGEGRVADLSSALVARNARNDPVRLPLKDGALSVEDAVTVLHVFNVPVIRRERRLPAPPIHTRKQRAWVAKPHSEGLAMPAPHTSVRARNSHGFVRLVQRMVDYEAHEEPLPHTLQRDHAGREIPALLLRLYHVRIASPIKSLLHAPPVEKFVLKRCKLVRRHFHNLGEQVRPKLVHGDGVLCVPRAQKFQISGHKHLLSPLLGHQETNVVKSVVLLDLPLELLPRHVRCRELEGVLSVIVLLVRVAVCVAVVALHYVPIPRIPRHALHRHTPQILPHTLHPHRLVLVSLP